MLIVADGAPGLIKAIEQCWPASDRQRCCVHRARNLYSKLPERERERVKHAYWQALDEAISEEDGKRRHQAIVDQLNNEGFTAAAHCLADDLDALVVHLRLPLRYSSGGTVRLLRSPGRSFFEHREQYSANQSVEGSFAAMILGGVSQQCSEQRRSGWCRGGANQSFE
jgi:hypothetical protein